MIVKKEGDLKLVNFRATQEDIKIIKKMAKKYAKGNVSAWLRYVAMNYKPTKKELK